MVNYLKQYDLSKKTSVVIGAAGLIGSEVASALAQAHARVVICDIAERRASRLTDKLQKKHHKVSYYNFDISDIKNLKNNINKLTRTFANISVWINCSYPKAEGFYTTSADINAESWQKNIDIHMNSCCISSSYIAEYMKKQRIEGSIVNLGSIYGVLGPDFNVYKGTDKTAPAAYSAIKGGIVNYTRYLASYYGKYRIRINVVCPGGIFDNQRKTFIKNYSKKVPLGRLADASEVASGILFLCSDASSYITGTTLMIDGGWSAV